MAEPYDSSVDAQYRLVDTDEVDNLLRVNGRPVSGSAKLVHFLTRVRGTLESQRETIVGLHKHIAQMQDHLSRVGQATTLNPLDALKYLDDEMREQLFDRIARDRLSMLRHQVESAQATGATLAAELDQVRSAAATMAQRPDLPVDVRADFTRLLAYLPSTVREVKTPGILDYPDLEPEQSALSDALDASLRSPVNPAGPTTAPMPTTTPAPSGAGPAAQPPSPPAPGRLMPRRRTGTPPAAPPGAAAPPWPTSTPFAESAIAAPQATAVPLPALVGETSAAAAHVDPQTLEAADTTPVYVDPWAAAAADPAPSYVNPWAAAAADPAPSYVDPYGGPVGTSSALGDVDPHAPAQTEQPAQPGALDPADTAPMVAEQMKEPSSASTPEQHPAPRANDDLFDLFD